MLQQLLFLSVLGLTLGIAYRGYRRVWQNIHLGKPEPFEGNRLERWRNTLLVAFGQQKMFKNWLPALFHLFIYVAFLITQVELIEILIDGITGKHRFFAPYLGGFYTFVINFIEILSVLALVATVVFLARRNLLKVPRFWKPEMRGWPFRDANYILIGEIVLIFGIFTMNSADGVLQTRGVDPYVPTGPLAISQWLGTTFLSTLDTPLLIGIERFGWWLHILTVFSFLCYLPYSKHLHILLAFPSTWYAPLRPKGQMTHMPEVQREVRILMGLEQPEANAPTELPVFGANDVFSLSRGHILQAYACTECGRCTAVCPANITGKKLSPRKIVMAVRDRAEEVGMNLASGKQHLQNYNDGKSLFDYISPEELHACTTCNACVEACPVLINPMEIILQMRRYEILTQGAGPSDWLPLFNALENNGAAWAMSEPRDAWRKN
ncbi:MAG: (Fe-S)-binding protein [Saprospiraceae bacterium]|nr:(Fe-S)-binding protein [Saprospiraceae bacterium]MDW8484107.1 (Fe-S)-binding protein [Saprospiraceae bacterium]